MKWRMLLQSQHTAAWNMALDQAILEAVEEGLVGPTLRVYGWSETAVTVGRFQNASRDVDLRFCSDQGIPVVRRPTGGRGILHGSDITVTFCARSKAIAGRPLSVADTYARFSAGFVEGLGLLGISLRPGTCRLPGIRTGDCFQIRSKADLIDAEGSKLIGSAMRRGAGAALLQSSVRHRPPDLNPEKVFPGTRVQIGYPLDRVKRGDIVDAIVHGFCLVHGVSFVVGDVTGWEEERAATLMNSLLVTENGVAAAALDGARDGVEVRGLSHPV